jgi:glycosyltransferase involved in cell wall biosynthesis
MLTKVTKICLILGSHWSYRKGGSEYQAQLLIDQLKKNRNYMIFYIYAGSEDAKVDIDGVRIYSLRRREVLSKLGKPFFLDSLKITKILNDVQPDVIYQRGGFAYTGIAAHFARKHRCKVIWHIASDNDVQPARFKSLCTAPVDYLNKKFLQYGIKYADYIIGQTKYEDRLLQQNYGRHCDLVVGNFHPIPKESIIKEKPLKVVWVATLKPNKQANVFICLARKLSDIRDVKFLMIGRPANGRNQGKIDRQMEGLDNFEYLGEQPIGTVNRILAESHILINTIKYEGFPNTFIHAWMQRVPVVSLNVDPDDILKKNRIGFHSKTFENLVRDTMQLVEDERLRNEMGQRAQNYALENHSIDSTIPRVLRLFESLA